MLCGADIAVCIETAPPPPLVTNRRSAVQGRAWQQMDGQSRLRLVERALRPAPSLDDGFPPAL